LLIVLDNNMLIAELERNVKTSEVNISTVIATMREKGEADAATLVKYWGIGIESAKRTRLVIT
jgi:isochorismate hydrolase